MEIIIKSDEQKTIRVSDNCLDNDNFVNVLIEYWEGTGAETTRKYVQGDFLISDLMPALIAFDAKRSRRLAEESELS